MLKPDRVLDARLQGTWLFRDSSPDRLHLKAVEEWSDHNASLTCRNGKLQIMLIVAARSGAVVCSGGRVRSRFKPGLLVA